MRFHRSCARVASCGIAQCLDITCCAWMCLRLTTANKNEFVELKARYIMCEQRQEQLDALRDGFRSVSHTAILHTHF